jgi:hypothetical protein
VYPSTGASNCLCVLSGNVILIIDSVRLVIHIGSGDTLLCASWPYVVNLPEGVKKKVSTRNESTKPHTAV